MTLKYEDVLLLGTKRNCISLLVATSMTTSTVQGSPRCLNQRCWLHRSGLARLFYDMVVLRFGVVVADPPDGTEECGIGFSDQFSRL